MPIEASINKVLLKNRLRAQDWPDSVASEITITKAREYRLTILVKMSYQVRFVLLDKPRCEDLAPCWNEHLNGRWINTLQLESFKIL